MNRLFPATWLRPAPLSAELDRLIQGLWSPAEAANGASAQADGGPAVNVHETETAFEVEMELPGMALEDIEVVLEGRDLTVRGERKGVELPEGASWQRRERFHGSFSRSLHFGVDLDTNRVQASLHQGVLVVTLPKPEAAKAHRIPISKQAPEVQKN